MKLLTKLLPKKKINVKETIKQIHREFYGASDEIVKLNNYAFTEEEKLQIDKAEQMANLGFKSLNWVIDALNKKYEKSIASKDYINYSYYKQHYPLHNFITKDSVEKICKKYSLLLAETSSFIGSIPQKNLQEILDFKLREEDIPYVRFYYRYTSLYFNCIPKEVWEEESKEERGDCSYIRDTGLEICASASDLKTSEGRVVGHMLIPDPIVLKPVYGGYLIVTAWGDEAADGSVINEKKN